MLRVGALVKPIRPPYTWRLGVVEAVEDDGLYKVRSYVAPPKSYEGSAGCYRADQIVEVPRRRVEMYLLRVQAEAEQKALLVQQIENALKAASG